MQACEWSERWTSLLLTMCTQQRFEVTLLDGEVLYTETSKVCVPVWLALGGIPVTWGLDRVFHCPRITPRAPHYGLKCEQRHFLLFSEDRQRRGVGKSVYWR